MANTWHAQTQAQTWAASTSRIDVLNGVSSARYIRCYRIWAVSTGTGAITGVIGTVRVARTTNATSGTTITPQPHSQAYGALDANTTFGTGRTLTIAATDYFRTFVVYSEEVAITTLSQMGLMTLVPYCEVWNAGYGDSNVEPLTCIPSTAQGVALVAQSGPTWAGAWDFEMEVTDAAS
jgi:hypothetical protein